MSASSAHASAGPTAAAGFDPGPANNTTNYTVTFSETGLPTNTTWSVRVCILGDCWDDDGAQFNSSNSSTMTFSLPNGTYYFHVHSSDQWASGTVASPSFGNFTVAGAPTSVSIHFASPAKYTVTFTETGLASGTTWSVHVVPVGQDDQGGQGGQGDDQQPTAAQPAATAQDGGSGGRGFNSSNTSTITFSLPNGSYFYWAKGVYGYSIVGARNGTFNVSGASPPTISIKFTAIQTFTVTFVENGLANATNWTVRLHRAGSGDDQGDQNGQGEHWRGRLSSEQTTSNSSMTFQLPNGTYRYHVDEVDGYQTNMSRGNFTVNGTTVTVTINFTALPTENVSFNESGLPVGTDWGLTITGHTGRVAGGPSEKIVVLGASPGVITFQLPNGHYHYSIVPMNGYRSTGGFHNKHFHVAGTALTGQIVFVHRGSSPGQAPHAQPAALSSALLGVVRAAERTAAGLAAIR